MTELVTKKDYTDLNQKNFILVRRFDSQPLLTVPTIGLANTIVDKLEPWDVVIIDLNVKHFSNDIDDSDIEILAKDNGYISPITNIDYE